MELQLFKKTSDDGTVLRYSLLVSIAFERYGTILNVAGGGFSGTLDPDTGSFEIELEEDEHLSDGEVAVDVPHHRNYLRVIDGVPLDGTATEIVVNVTNRVGGVQTGTVVIADADEEEARPIGSLSI